MGTIIQIIIAGFLATLAMSILMESITRSKIANADMVRAIGSMLTETYENSYLPGMLVHFTVGTIVAFFYAAFLTFLNPLSVVGYTLFGGMIGVGHGVAFSFILVIGVAEHHPLEQFRKAGDKVAVAHFFGHVVYGLVVGVVLGAFHTRFL